MLKYDVAIVGGGPIGGHVASKIAEKNFRVAIFEKNKEIGQHLNCAGLVTPRVLELTEIPRKEIIQNKIKGANVHSPSNKIITIGGNKVHALSIDRMLFDKEIIRQAKKKGADIYLGNKIARVERDNNSYKIKSSENIESRCKLLVGADGPHSKIRKSLYFPQPKEFLTGIGAEIINTNLDSEFVEIFVGRKIAPGFFAWIIPTNKDVTNARIGLCTVQKAKHSAKYYFNKMLKHKYFQLYIKNCEIKRMVGGTIPLGALKKTYADNVMFVGDAAAQVKPTSGGGLYSGLLCANLCSEVAIEALQKNNFTSDFLKKYQKLWQKEIGSELKKGMRFRTLFKTLTDKRLDKYLEKLQNPELIETINKYGDIDYPSKLVKPLLKKSRFFI